MNFGGFNSAEKTLPSPSLSPALDISSPFEIHLHLQHHFPEILFCRNMRISRRSFHDLLMFRERTHAGSPIQSRSLRNPYVAKFDDPMTDGCQGTKDFLA